MTTLQENAAHGVQFLQAYLECSDQLQVEVKKLLEVLKDPETDTDDRASTLMTLADILLPNPHMGQLGMDLEQSERDGAAYSEEMRIAVEELDSEEAIFSDRLRETLTEKGITQAELAERAGVGQPAVSLMLNRQCRPQRRTIEKFSKALGVPPESLWPNFASDK